jgi:hypothetical protein
MIMIKFPRSPASPFAISNCHRKPTRAHPLRTWINSPTLPDIFIFSMWLLPGAVQETAHSAVHLSSGAHRFEPTPLAILSINWNYSPKFEIDDRLDQESILTYGNALRNAFYKSLPLFVQDIDLINDPEYDRLHADFYSRLAMTFSHGDYSKIDVIPDKKAIAETLFKKSLAFCPDHRSYLGLGMLYQQQASLDKSIQILDQGLLYFGSSVDLNICQGINYMNLRDFNRALTYFLDYQDQEQVRPYIMKCYEAMGKS